MEDHPVPAAGLLLVHQAGQSVDENQFATEMDKSVLYIVERQARAGIDVGNDGEPVTLEVLDDRH